MLMHVKVKAAGCTRSTIVSLSISFAGSESPVIAHDAIGAGSIRLHAVDDSVRIARQAATENNMATETQMDIGDVHFGANEFRMRRETCDKVVTNKRWGPDQYIHHKVLCIWCDWLTGWLAD